MSQLTKNHSKKWPKSALNSAGQYVPTVYVSFLNEHIEVPIFDGEASWQDIGLLENQTISTLESKTYRKQRYVIADSVEEAIKQVESEFYEVLPSNILKELSFSIDELGEHPEHYYTYTMYIRKWTDLEIACFKLGDLCD